MKFKLLFFSFLIAFSVKSQIDFTHNWSGGMGTGNGNNLRSSAVDGSGNLFIIGQMTGIMDFDFGPGVMNYTAGASCYIAKYDISGALIWVNLLTGSGISQGSKIGVDGSGDVYISGYFNSGDIDFDPGVGVQSYTASQTDLFIAKYNSAGAYQWVNVIQGIATNPLDYLNMKVNSAGDLVVCGHFEITTDFDPGVGVTTLTNIAQEDAFITKYNSAGNFQWAIGFGGSDQDFVYGVDVDATNNIYVTGQFETVVDFNPGVPVYTLSTNGAEDAFIAKFTAAGVFDWAANIGGVSKEIGIDIAFGNNEVIVSGLMQSATIDADPGPGTYTLSKAGLGVNDTYLIKLNSGNGSLIWAKSTGVQILGSVVTRDITLDSQNNIYLTGSFQDIVDFDLGAGSYTLAAVTASNADIFIAKYDNSSNFIYVKNMGGGSISGNTGMSINLYNYNVFIAGEFRNIIDIDPGPATVTIAPTAGTDIFVAKYTECNLPVMTSITGPPPVCSGISATISITGTLNQAANWQWYSGSCGGPTVSTGATLVVSPTVTTAYFVRGVGGCAPGGMACFNSSVIVNPLTNISGQVTTNTATPVSGSVTLYRYETQFTKFDSITTVPMDVNGNYTVLSAPSYSYIIKAIPTATNLLITYAPNAISWKGATTFFHGCSGVTSQNVNVVALTNFGGGPGMLTGKIVQGAKYGQKGAQVLVPGNPIKGISVKGGRNPGGNIGSTDMTSPTGGYTLGGLAVNGVGESYFILVDVPGLDTNNTYHKIIAAGTETFTQLDFVIDSAKIHPMIFVGVKEEKFENNSVKIFPNPTNGKLFIECDLAKPCDVKIEIMDMLGRTVETILPMSFQDTKQLTIISDIKKLQHGIYFINIEAGGSKKTTKILLTE